MSCKYTGNNVKDIMNHKLSNISLYWRGKQCQGMIRQDSTICKTRCDLFPVLVRHQLENGTPLWALHARERGQTTEENEENGNRFGRVVGFVRRELTKAIISHQICKSLLEIICLQCPEYVRLVTKVSRCSKYNTSLTLGKCFECNVILCHVILE